MKYKVGDKVKVRSDLNYEEYSEGVPFTSEMDKFKGTVLEVRKIAGGVYEMVGIPYIFTDEMLEPVEEMSAEEALKTYTEFCGEHSCNDCPIQNLDTTYYCPDIRKEYPEDVVKVLKQWKADHEKKPIETKWVWYVKIIEADTHLLKHEELLELDFSIPMDRKKEEILKKYCAEHDGKYYVTDERRCVVKE